MALDQLGATVVRAVGFGKRGGMKVRFWGTRGSIANPGLSTLRYGCNTSCVEIETARGTRIVLDCGKVSIIMFTGRVGNADTREGTDAGADDYLTKPFSAAHVRSRVRLWLDRGAARGSTGTQFSSSPIAMGEGG